MRHLRLVLTAVVLAALVAACSTAGSAPGPSSTLPSGSTAASQAALSKTPLPPPSPSPSPSSSALLLKLVVTGDPYRWVPRSLAGPVGEPFQIAMTVNNDDTHNLWIVTTSQFETERAAIIDQTGQALFKGGDQVRSGTKTYEIPALKAGTYLFVCTYHLLTMTGTLTVP